MPRVLKENCRNTPEFFRVEATMNFIYRDISTYCDTAADLWGGGCTPPPGNSTPCRPKESSLVLFEDIHFWLVEIVLKVRLAPVYTLIVTRNFSDTDFAKSSCLREKSKS